MADSVQHFQAKLKAGITEVKFLLTHPMENGARTEVETGKVIPAHFIQEIACEYAGKTVMSALWSGSVSKNPYCAFSFKGGQAGESVKLQWKDNLGQTDSAETLIKVDK